MGANSGDDDEPTNGTRLESGTETVEVDVDSEGTGIGPAATDIKSDETDIGLDETDIRHDETDIRYDETDIRPDERSTELEGTDNKPTETSNKPPQPGIEQLETTSRHSETEIKASESLDNEGRDSIVEAINNEISENFRFIDEELVCHDDDYDEGALRTDSRYIPLFCTCAVPIW